VNQTDKRRGGKRRPRITMPTLKTERNWSRMFRINFTDSDKKDWFTDVVAKTTAIAEQAVIGGNYSGRKLKSIEVVNQSVLQVYQTYDVRYRGEHQDLLAAK
jgi:hypothetical protein